MSMSPMGMNTNAATPQFGGLKRKAAAVALAASAITGVGMATGVGPAGAAPASAANGCTICAPDEDFATVARNEVLQARPRIISAFQSGGRNAAVAEGRSLAQRLINLRGLNIEI
jgi:hypothetical protein